MAALIGDSVTAFWGRRCVFVTPQELALLEHPVRDVTVTGTGLLMESDQVFPCLSLDCFSCSGLPFHLASRAVVLMGESKGSCDMCVIFDASTAWGDEKGRKQISRLTVLWQKLSRNLSVHRIN